MLEANESPGGAPTWGAARHTGVIWPVTPLLGARGATKDGRVDGMQPSALVRWTIVAVAVVAPLGCGRWEESGAGRENPTIQLIEPVVGTVWRDSFIGTIGWRTGGVPDVPLQVQLSRDGGTTWTVLATLGGKVGAYDWPASGIQDGVLVQVVSEDGRLRSRSRSVDVAAYPVQVSFGTNPVAAVMSDGSARLWGFYPASFGQVPGDIPSPVPLVGVDHVVSIVAGGDYVLALRDDGTVSEWGDVDSLYEKPPVLQPQQVPGLDNVGFVAAGFNAYYAVRQDGAAFVWGRTARATLGDFADVTEELPARVPELDNSVAVAVGNLHGLALRADGTVLAWGANSSGELGDGTYQDRFTPMPVVGIQNAVAIATRGAFSMALRDDGTVVTWGANERGALGDGTQLDRPFADVVPGLGNIASISAGFSTAYALRDDGALLAWGANERGEVGDGTTMDRLIPGFVGVPPLERVWAGEATVHARGLDGQWYGWGSGSFYELGDGTSKDKGTPVVLKAK